MHPGPYPTRPQPNPSLHLLAGLWVASCPACGFQLATARIQARRERPQHPPHLPRLPRPACPKEEGIVHVNLHLTDGT